MTSAAPRRGLIDTQLLIEIRSGQAQAHQFAVTILTTGTFDLSELSGMALLVQCRNAREFQDNVAFLGHCRVHRITALISQRAFRIMAALTPPVALTADDAIVAATALQNKLP